MKQKISVLGCGWLGLPLAISLVSKNFDVKGSTTSVEKLRDLTSKKIESYVVDINTDDICSSQFLSSEILVILIPSKNVEGFKRLISFIETSDVKKVVYISSTSVYPNLNKVVTEEATLKEAPLVEIEQLFNENSKFETTVIRFAGLFGGNRKPGNFPRKGKKMENPEGFINLIHRNDCIRIIEEIIDRGVWNETFNACADTHPKRREFYTKEAAKIGRETIVFNEESSNEYKIVSSEKLKVMLGFSFEHSDLLNYYE